jgi:excisionase family DNA binding protein
MRMAIAGRDLVDGAELARKMSVGRTTVWRLAKLGRIPYFIVGRRWLFDEAEVLEALRAVAVAGKRPANDTQLPSTRDDNPSK